MLIVLIMLWTVSAILLASDPKRGSIRWLSALSFCGGAGALSAVLGDQMIPRLQEQTLIQWLYIIERACSLLQYYGLPYTYVMFAVHYNPSGGAARLAKWLPILLLLPIAATIAFVHPVYPPPFSVLPLWVFPYVLYGSYRIWIKKETIPVLKRNHRFTAGAVVPAVLLCAAMNYGFPLFGVYEMWRFNTWIIIVSFTLFLIALFSYGFLGIQIFVQRKRLDSAFRAVTTGTAILNHAIKNDVGKMKLYTQKINSYAQETGQAELEKDIQVIQSAGQHIQDMILRVHHQTKEIVLRREYLDAAALIERIVQSLQPAMKQVVVKTSYRTAEPLYADPVHIAETLHNIVSNAVEAMPQGGELKVRYFETKRTLMIVVRDTGDGIDKSNLKRIMEPFFTTKNRMNFGLGLAYCYKVMQEHGGSIDIESEKGKGTSVYLSFPKTQSRRLWSWSKR